MILSILIFFKEKYSFAWNKFSKYSNEKERVQLSPDQRSDSGDIGKKRLLSISYDFSKKDSLTGGQPMES
jgi:hypothetical protein